MGNQLNSFVKIMFEFGRVDAALSTDRHELHKVEGIGDNLAEGIRAAVKEHINADSFEDDFPI